MPCQDWACHQIFGLRQNGGKGEPSSVDGPYNLGQQEWISAGVPVDPLVPLNRAYDRPDWRTRIVFVTDPLLLNRPVDYIGSCSDGRTVKTARFLDVKLTVCGTFPERMRKEMIPPEAWDIIHLYLAMVGTVPRCGIYTVVWSKI